jgi:hypothetical protein
MLIPDNPKIIADNRPAIFIIVIGSTLLWAVAFLCTAPLSPLLSSDFATAHFSSLDCQPYTNPHQSWRIDVFLSGSSPLAERSNWGVSGTRFPPLHHLAAHTHTLPRDHGVDMACLRPGKNTWHFLWFVSTHPLARYFHRTTYTPLVPDILYGTVKYTRKLEHTK